ncbi:MAG TPA: tetratricopeptide repeat protein, partial [Anaerolineales bacterium]
MLLPKVLRTKIIPPRRSARTLPRPRVSRALAEALQYRLTTLQAGAGYGKTTALGVLAEEIRPLIWYQTTEEDADPLVFLLHLCHATQQALPGLQGLPTSFLEAWDGMRGPLPASGVVDQYLNALSEGQDLPILLVLDDVHLAASAPEVALLLDRLIGLAPPNLHLLLACRPPLKLPNLSRWRLQGEVLSLDQSVLAFNAAEIAALFARHYSYELTPEEVDSLLSNTEGWAIALQLIWQSLRSGSSTSVEESFRQAGSLDSLFDLLAREIFAGQPLDVQEFLLVSATLREMTPEACDAVRANGGAGQDRTSGQAGFAGQTGFAGQASFAGRVSPAALAGNSSAAMLAHLRSQELFVVDLGEGGAVRPAPDEPRPGGEREAALRLRYHPIFQRFLRRQTPPEQRLLWHARAAEYFRRQGDPDQAIYHLLRAEDVEGAASLLEPYGLQLLAMGRLDTLAAYLDALSAETLRQHPALLSFLGDLARLHSRFTEALGWYQQAEAVWRERGQREGIGRALRGQARIYLDTVNPSKAEELLQQATRLSDGIDDRESQARLYELLAENKLNAGRVEEAERLHQQAEDLRAEGPSDSQLSYRVLLRTGRLEEARLQLEARAAAERAEPVHTPRAHRETLLLLSLIYAFQGQAQEAYRAALEGTRRGDELQSPFVTAVGHMRQGHALMLFPGPERYALARQQFEKTIELSRTLAVSRLRVEAYWGLCRAFGYQGELAQALVVAQEGVEIASQAGDEWIASLVRLSMGASLALAARSGAKLGFEAAEEWLSQALIGFQDCSDSFGQAAARLWLCCVWFYQKGPERRLRLAQTLPEVLATCRQAGYDFLFTRPSLLSPPDGRILVPLLVEARRQGWEAAYAGQLLKALGLAETELHPGYQLRVHTLGAFQAWRGGQLIPPSAWRREKARQLFQLLLTYRHSPLDRDQITEALWPGLDPAAAQRNFKVTLNTLYNVLEPGREPGKDSAYIVREGSTYGLRPGADLWLDAEAFTGLLRQAPAGRAEAATTLLEQALDLYQGEYLHPGDLLVLNQTRVIPARLYARKIPSGG